MDSVNRFTHGTGRKVSREIGEVLYGWTVFTGKNVVPDRSSQWQAV